MADIEPGQSTVELAVLKRAPIRTIGPARRQGDTDAFASLRRVSFGSPNLDSLLVVLLRRWRWISSAGCVCGVAALLALPFLTPQYEISASLLYRLLREPASGSFSGAAPGRVPYQRIEDIGSEVEVLKSQQLVETLVHTLGTEYFLKRKEPQTILEHIKAFVRSIARGVRTAFTEVQIWIGLEKRLTPFEQIVANLQASIAVDAVKKADVISISLLAPDQTSGVEVLSRFLEIYLAEHVRVFQTPGTVQFLSERVATLKNDLAQLEDQKRAFGKDSAVWDFGEQRKLLLQRQNEMRTDLARTQAELSKVQSDISKGGQQLNQDVNSRSSSNTEQANPVVQGLQTRIAEHRAALERMRLTLGDANQRVKDTQTEIRNLELALAANSRSVAQSDLQELRTRFGALTAQAQRQSQDLAQIDRDLAVLGGQGEGASKLQREITLLERSYQLYAQRLEEARIAEALDAAQISNVAVVSAPIASVRPVSPRSRLIFLGSIAGGILGAIGLILLADAQRPVVHSRDRAVAILDAPVLCRLPEVRT